MKRFTRLSSLALLLGASFISTPTLAHQGINAIELEKKHLDEFSKTNSLKDIDIYGINADRGVIHVGPSSKLLKFLEENNFSFTESFSMTNKEKERAMEYPRPETVLEDIKETAKRYPEIIKYTELTTTHQGRPLAALEITNDFSVDKPVIVFNGLHHSREVMTVPVVLSIAEELGAGFKSGDREIEGFLNEYKIIVIPMVNPDGYAQVFDKNYYWRKNGWPNQYGRIVGVDLNRNYPVLFDACGGSHDRSRSDTYRGESPGSEPEVQAMIALMEKYRPVANISYHSFSELILYPFGCESRPNTAKELFVNIANKLKAKITNDQGKKGKYRVGTTPELLYQADGMDIDTHWAEYGVLSFTIEMNSDMLGWFPDKNEWTSKTVDSQKEGWKELIRIAGKSAVEFTAKDNYTYRVIKDDGKSFTEGYAVKPFVANKGKVTRRLLLPGNYSLEISKGKNVVKVIDVTVKDGVSKLGTL